MTRHTPTGGAQKTAPGETVPKHCNSEIKNCRSVINSTETGSQNGNPAAQVVGQKGLLANKVVIPRPRPELLNEMI